MRLLVLFVLLLAPFSPSIGMAGESLGDSPQVSRRTVLECGAALGLSSVLSPVESPEPERRVIITTSVLGEEPIAHIDGKLDEYAHSHGAPLLVFEVKPVDDEGASSTSLATDVQVMKGPTGHPALAISPGVNIGDVPVIFSDLGSIAREPGRFGHVATEVIMEYDPERREYVFLGASFIQMRGDGTLFAERIPFGARRGRSVESTPPASFSSRRSGF